MNTLRYLTFEINRTCRNSEVHSDKCPISHVERYKFSTSCTSINDPIIIGFWRWCRKKGFRGIVLWHMYNEPVLSLPRVLGLMKIMKEEDNFQPFQLTTSIEGDYKDFDIVKFSDYKNGVQLDDRILTNEGEGKNYNQMPQKGWCARGLGWEIPIDNFGNWCLCCNDWRCEEAIGNIFDTDWEFLYMRYKAKKKRFRWHDSQSYYNMPRMCRACLDKNPSLTKSGGI